MIASFSKYILKGFLEEWLSSKDLLKLLSARNTDEDDNVQTTMFVYALTALFLKHKSTSDLKYHSRLLGGRSNNTLFKVALEDRAFITSLEKSLRSMVADGDYRNSVLDMWTQYRVTIDPSEIHHNSVSTHLIGYLENRGELISHNQLVAITQFIPYLEPEEVHPFIEPILAKLNDNDTDSKTCCVVLRAIAALISKLEPVELHRLIEPIFAKFNDADPDVRAAAASTIRVLISKLEPAEASSFIEPIFAKLNDAHSFVREAALWVIIASISKLEKTKVKPFIKFILAKLNGADPFVRSEALEDITALIPKLEPVGAHLFLNCILETLNDAHPFVRVAALRAILALISKLETTEIKSFTKRILETLNDADPFVRAAALRVITALIPKLETTEIKSFTKRILETLNDAHPFVRAAALRAILALISKLETTEIKSFTKRILETLKDTNNEIYVILQVITILISKLELEEGYPCIEAILSKLNDVNPSVRSSALRAITVLISKLEPEEVHPFIEPIVAKLNDAESEVRAAVLEVMAALSSKLERGKSQQFIAWALETLHDKDNSVSYSTLKAEAMRLIDRGKNLDEIILKLHTLNDRDLFALKVMNLLVPKASEADLPKLFEVLMKGLYDTREAIRKEAFNTLSCMIVFHPKFPYTFSNRNASEKEVELVKMVERQAMIQEPDAISYSNLETIVSADQTRSWYKTFFDDLRWAFGFATPDQSRVIMEMHLLLAMKKPVYTKIEIEAALKKDEDAQYHLRLFRNEETPRSNSGTDDGIIYRLGQKFQCR